MRKKRNREDGVSSFLSWKNRFDHIILIHTLPQVHSRSQTFGKQFLTTEEVKGFLTS